MAYARAYREYFERHAPQAKEPKTMLDPAPRVVLDPELGLCAAGRTAKDAAIVEELYEHTIDVIARRGARRLRGAAAARHLRRRVLGPRAGQAAQSRASRPLFAGEVALVTGAASGIGKACVEALARARRRGGRPRSSIQRSTTLHRRADFLGVRCDVTSQQEVSRRARSDGACTSAASTCWC